MFTAYHTNFGTRRDFTTEAEARAWIVKAGFEASLWYDAFNLVATWAPIGGWRNR